MSKILVAYFSHKGENYWKGGRKILEKGNTAIVAETIAAAVGGDLFEIDTVVPYSESYDTCVAEARRDIKEDARPALTATVDTMADYDTIFLGYPNWCGTCPMAIYTFVESYNLAGKTMAPFCSNGGSGVKASEDDLRKACPDTTVVAGLSVKGEESESMAPEIKAWAKAVVK